MGTDCDPYRDWLGIKDEQRPLTNYQLLGLDPFESHNELIETRSQRHLAMLGLKVLAPARVGQRLAPGGSGGKHSPRSSACSQVNTPVSMKLRFRDR